MSGLPARDDGLVRFCAADAEGLRLALANSPDAIEAGRLALIDHLGPLALSARVIHRLEVIFEELVSNAVRHGFTPGSDQSIAVTVSTGRDQLRLVFEDDGVPFNPLEVPAPAPFQSLETARLGGLGIPLVVRLSLEVRYERVTATGERPAAAGGFAPVNRTVVILSATA